MLVRVGATAESPESGSVSEVEEEESFCGVAIVIAAPPRAAA